MTHPARLPATCRAAVVVVLAAVALLAVSCGPSTNDASRFGGRDVRRTPGTAGPATATTEAPRPYPVQLRSVTCPFAAASANGLSVECKNLTVPMSRTKLDGKTVTLAVAIIHSTSPTPQPDPVVYLSGGPGGVSVARIDEWTKPAAAMLADRDLILVDQRGTGYSTPTLSCDPKIDNDATETASVVAEDCVRALRNDGVDLAAFNTTENANDIADLRVALQLPAWNLFGISYGTRLALWIMKLRPEGIRSVVIDSVYPPGVNGWESIAPDLYRAIHQISSDCAAEPACNAAYPDVEGTLNRAIDQLVAKHATRSADELVSQLFDALYQSLVMPDIPKAIADAARGDLTNAFDLFQGAGALKRHPELRDEAPPASSYSRPKRSQAMHLSVECAETAPLTSPDAVRAAFKAVPSKISDTLLRSQLTSLAACNVWGVPPNPLSDVTSDIPTLVLAGTYDPITPPEWGQRAASHLSHSRYVEVAGSGHAVWADGDCPKTLIKQYIDDPAAPGPDCTVPPPTFETT